jgi:hypothetical protein
MLPPAVYKKIYEIGRTGGLIIEVGTALGAATVALALGLRDSGKPGRVVTFDPMTGGPMRSLTDPERRADLVRSSLHYFDAAESVEIVTKTLPEGMPALGKDEPISVLMLDADGRIDRDILAVRSRLRAGTKLIIDDDSDLLRLFRRESTHVRVDQKMRLVHLLVERFKRERIISVGEHIKDTYFGEVLSDAPNIGTNSLLEEYRKLVFGEAPWKYRARLRQWLLDGLDRIAPKFLQNARVIYRNSKTKL